MKDIKALSDQVRQTAYDIHVYHAHGHLEKVYENALTHRLRNAGLDVRQQHPITVYDEDGTVIGEYLADLLVEGVLIVELKTAKALAPEHEAQILGYLKSSRLEHGLLINFGSFKFEIRKFAWTEKQPQRTQRTQRVLGFLLSAFFAFSAFFAVKSPAYLARRPGEVVPREIPGEGGKGFNRREHKDHRESRLSALSAFFAVKS